MIGKVQIKYLISQEQGANMDKIKYTEMRLAKRVDKGHSFFIKAFMNFCDVKFCFILY